MRHLHIRHEQAVMDPLHQERLLRALRIILEHQTTIFTSRVGVSYPTMNFSMRGSAAHGSTGRRWIGCVMGRSAGNSTPWWSCPRID
jgi:hypothetical protein